MDTANHFGVGIHGERIRIMLPVPETLTKDQAMNLAAWLAAMADLFDQQGEGGFDELLEAVRAT